MSKEWWDNIYYIAKETNRLGRDFEFHVSNGFVAGGPWIKPCDAMKRLESVETVVAGGMPLALKLQAPDNKYNFYRDVRVIAIPTKDFPEVCMKFSANISQITPELLFGGQELYNIPTLKAVPIYIDIDYTKVIALRSISYIRINQHSLI